MEQKHQVSNCIKTYSAHFCMIFFSWQSCQILLLIGTLAYFQSAMSPAKRGMRLSRFLILLPFIDLSLSFTAGSLMGVCTWVISLEILMLKEDLDILSSTRMLTVAFSFFSKSLTPTSYILAFPA